MRLALTHPFCWPYVRRGTERNMEELALHLTARGHEVTTVSSWPGPSRDEHSAGGRRVLLSPMWHPWLGAIRIQRQHTFIFRSLPTLRSLDVDVVHSFGWADALAASLARAGRRYRTVVQMNGAPIPAAHYLRFPPERWMIRRALERADRVIACSRFVRDLLREHYGIEATVIAPGVSLDRFAPGSVPADGEPVLLSVADFDVRRKGLRVLVRAFAEVKRDVPAARLRLSGRLSPVTEQEVIGPLPQPVREAIEVLGLGNPDDVPAQYREATLTVLPSMWEPSGTVLIESWASGTPVVATAHGGLPEFVGDGVGVLFDPAGTGEETSNAEGLAAAIVEGLALAARPGTRARCRAHAERCSWRVVAPQMESVYTE